jgi:predicted small secreted protein
MDAATIVPIILAIISLLGTVAIAILNHYSSNKLHDKSEQATKQLQQDSQKAAKELHDKATKAAKDQEDYSQQLTGKFVLLKEERLEKKDMEALIYKYGQPLLVAAYELQARLYELCQYPISKAHLESKEGRQDLKQYTCYKFAQYFAWSHILRTKAQFFSFSEDENLKSIGTLILCVEEEFD